MLPAWLAACSITAVFVAAVHRLPEAPRERCDRPQLRLGLGAAAVVAAARLVLVLPNPALPVLGLGLTAAGVRRLRERPGLRMLAPLFAISVGLGTLAWAWGGPTRLLASADPCATAAVATLGSILVNNLPAAVLLSAHRPPHTPALLLGLDLGPNLAVTGSLSAFLWLRSARAVGADVSVAVYSRLGALLVPLTLAGALAVESWAS